MMFLAYQVAPPCWHRLLFQLCTIEQTGVLTEAAVQPQHDLSPVDRFYTLHEGDLVKGVLTLPGGSALHELRENMLEYKDDWIATWIRQTFFHNFSDEDLGEACNDLRNRLRDLLPSGLLDDLWYMRYVSVC